MTAPTRHTDRAARLAALRMERERVAAAEPSRADSTEPTPSGFPTTSWNPSGAAIPTRHRPARVGKVATVGLSITAVLSLMAALGRGEQTAASSVSPVIATDPRSSLPEKPGTIRVAADAEAVVLVVDSLGRPVDLVHLPSIGDLKAFLENATPIIPPAAMAPPAAGIPAAGTELVVPPTPAATPAGQVAVAPEQTAPAVAAAYPTTPEAAVPTAQPAPVELVIPLPAPVPTGNTAGS